MCNVLVLVQYSGLIVFQLIPMDVFWFFLNELSQKMDELSTNKLRKKQTSSARGIFYL